MPAGLLSGIFYVAANVAATIPATCLQNVGSRSSVWVSFENNFI